MVRPDGPSASPTLPADLSPAPPSSHHAARAAAAAVATAPIRPPTIVYLQGVIQATVLLALVVRDLKPQGADLAAFVVMWASPTVHLPATVGYHQMLPMSKEVRRGP